MKCKSTLISGTTPLFALVAVIMFTSSASAEKYKKIVNGKEVVVHTNPIPVILHRMVPPQYGRHVTQREVSNASTPQTRKNETIRKR